MNKYNITATRLVVAPEHKNVLEPTFEHAEQQYATISVMARAHRQHIWNETQLVGVSAAGTKNLERFFKDHPSSDGWRITVDATKYGPKLVGWNPSP
jgi:hypothetical protein